jgi:hypothetical protein
MNVAEDVNGPPYYNSKETSSWRAWPCSNSVDKGHSLTHPIPPVELQITVFGKAEQLTLIRIKASRSRGLEYSDERSELTNMQSQNITELAIFKEFVCMYFCEHAVEVVSRGHATR